MVRHISDAELRRNWEEFLTDYDYIPTIEEAADRYPDVLSVYVDYSSIQMYNVDFALYILENPAYAIEVGEQVMTGFYPPESVPEGQRLHLRLIGIPRERYIDIRELRSKHIGRLISLEGLVKKVTEVRPRLIEGAFRCKSCGAVIMQSQSGGEFRQPAACYEEQGGCGKKGGGFLLLPEKSVFVDYQRVEVQEPPEGLRGGDQPARLTVTVEDDLTGHISPGDRLTLHGILRSKQRISGGRASTTFDILLEANSFEQERHENEDFEPTEEELERIREEAEDPELFKHLVESISPTIKGHDDIKAAIALQMFGGVTKVMDDGTRMRGDIHILLFGDPGTGKSQMLKYAASLAPRGIFASGRSSSAAGLTAAAVKDEFGEGRWTLEAGALVLADMGLAAIDELDKMDKNDRSSMHEAMEQQTISVNKAGISATLQARCSVLAAANPIAGKFLEEKDLLEQLNIPAPLLSRFDLIFTIQDRPEEGRDREIAHHILTGHQRGEAKMMQEQGIEDEEISRVEDTTEEFKPHFSMDFLKKYIAYARKITPLFTEEAKKKLEDFYVDLRMGRLDSGLADVLGGKHQPFTARQIEGLIRLAEASARARLSMRVEEVDADNAISMVESYVRRLGSSMYDVATGVPKTKATRIELVEKAISHEFASDIQTIISKVQAVDKTISQADVEKVIMNMKSRGLVYEPEPGKYKYAA